MQTAHPILCFILRWAQVASGDWRATPQLTTASFSHDPTGRADRLDRFMGLENGQFFLSHGGFVPGFTKYGEKFDRPATGTAPSDIALPPVSIRQSSKAGASPADGGG